MTTALPDDAFEWQTYGLVDEEPPPPPDPPTYTEVTTDTAPVSWWRLGDTASGTAVDSIAGYNMTGGTTFNVTGLISGDSDTAFQPPTTSTGRYAASYTTTSTVSYRVG
jgi:hypothetical protein